MVRYNEKGALQGRLSRVFDLMEAAGIEPGDGSAVSPGGSSVPRLKGIEDGGKDGDSLRKSEPLAASLLRRAADAEAAGENAAPFLAAYEAECERSRHERGEGSGTVLRLGG